MLRKTRQKLTYYFLKNQYLDHFRSTPNTWTLGTLEVCKKWSLTEQKEYLNRGHKTFVVKKKMRKWENWLVNQAFFILSSVSLKISKRPFFQAIHALCVPNLAATWRTHKHFYPNASLGIIFDGFEAFVGNSRFFLLKLLRLRKKCNSTTTERCN